jgi:hypothetical protein
MGVEGCLNYVWALVAVACAWLWLGWGTPVNRRLSFAGLFLFIVILFPVISVSDDLWRIKNRTETKTLQLRDRCETRPHSAFTATAALPEPAVAKLSFGFQRLGASLHARCSQSTSLPLSPSRTVLLLRHDRTSSMIQILFFFLTDVAVRNTV